jgi:hypothetical protein
MLRLHTNRNTYPIFGCANNSQLPIHKKAGASGHEKYLSLTTTAIKQNLHTLKCCRFGA